VRDLSSVDLNLLVALDLLLDEGSVRGAARRAHVTPSAMSHTLGRLRELLGDDVLVRAGRRMVPTPRATALAPGVKDLLAAARTVLAQPGPFAPAQLQRRFVVVCTDHVSTVLLPRVEAILQRDAPQVDLVVAPLIPNTMEDLRQGAVDLAIGVFPEATPEVRRRRLFTDRFVTVCRPGHPRVQGELSLDGFLSEAHALVAPRGTPSGLVDRRLAALGHERRVARAFPSFLAALWHVAHSDALLTVSRRLVDAVQRALPLVVLSPPLALDDYVLRMVWHPRVDRAPADRWFRSTLVAAAEALPALPGATDSGIGPTS